jgi:hypothetical protein
MMPPVQGAREHYVEYLGRFEAIHGDLGVGRFVKHDGRLVKKLAFEEFEELYGEYEDVARQYFTSVRRGDTVNDVAVKLLRELASNLLLTSPV